MTAIARDAAGNTTISDAVTVTVNNVDLTPPNVSITEPADGSTVSSIANLTAHATDNVGVVGVQFKLDGADLGSEVTASPYEISRDTSGLANGPYTLTAVARDAAGNITTSDVITINVRKVAQMAPIMVVTRPVEAILHGNLGVSGSYLASNG